MYVVVEWRDGVGEYGCIEGVSRCVRSECLFGVVFGVSVSRVGVIRRCSLFGCKFCFLQRLAIGWLAVRVGSGCRMGWSCVGVGIRWLCVVVRGCLVEYARLAVWW